MCVRKCGGLVWLPWLLAVSGAVSGAPVRAGTGTAFVVHQDGYLLTSAQVVRQAVRVEVSLGSRQWTAAILASDDQLDLAILQVQAHNLPALPLGEAAEPAAGAVLQAWGIGESDTSSERLKPLPSALESVSAAAAGRLLLLDLPVTAGHLGGPVANAKGEIVGVLSGKLSATRPATAAAVPAGAAVAFLREQEVPYVPAVTGTASEALARVAGSVAKVTCYTEGSGITSPAKPGPEPKPLPVPETRPAPELKPVPDSRPVAGGLAAKAGPTFAKPAAPVLCVAFARDGQSLVLGTQDGEVFRWRLTAGSSSSGRFKPDRQTRCEVQAAAFVPGADRFAVTGLGARPTMLKGDCEFDRNLPIVGSEVMSLSWTEDGAYWAAAGYGDVMVDENGRKEKRFRTYVAYGDGRKCDLSDGRMWAGELRILHLAHAPDNKTLAMAFSDATVRLMPRDAEGKPARDLTVLKAVGGAARCVAYLPSGVLLSGSEDGTVSAWATSTATRQTLFKEPLGRAVCALAGSPDGRWLAVAVGAPAATTGAIHLVEAATGKLVASIALDSACPAVAWSADGKQLAAAVGKTAQLWTLSAVAE